MLKKGVFKDLTEEEKREHRDVLMREVILQHLIRFPEFSEIPMGKLKRHSEVIAGLMDNILRTVETSDKEIQILRYEDLMDPHLMRNRAINIE
jgi:hypothetical protein